MHEFQEVKKKSREEGDNEEEELEKHPGGEVCEEETLFGNIVLVLEPVLFAFAIEFVLIGELEQSVKLEGKLINFFFRRNGFYQHVACSGRSRLPTGRWKSCDGAPHQVHINSS